MIIEKIKYIKGLRRFYKSIDNKFYKLYLCLEKITQIFFEDKVYINKTRVKNKLQDFFIFITPNQKDLLYISFKGFKKYYKEIIF